MIRVIYRWQVEAENMSQFRREWSIATNKIHDTVPGALGSFMLQDSERPNQILTIAKWDSKASWQAFWDMQNPPEMEKMRELGKYLSATAYDEIDDFTR